MFQFPGFAFLSLYIQPKNTWSYTLIITSLATTQCFDRRSKCTDQRSARSVHCEAITEYNQVGCPIQKSMDQSLFSAPHGLSQSITSFIASYCQGIHQTPFSRLIWSRKSQTLVIPKPKILGASPNVARWFTYDHFLRSKVIHFPSKHNLIRLNNEHY